MAILFEIGLSYSRLIVDIGAELAHETEHLHGVEFGGRGLGARQPVVEVPFVVEAIDDAIVLVELTRAHLGQMLGGEIGQQEPVLGYAALPALVHETRALLVRRLAVARPLQLVEARLHLLEVVPLLVVLDGLFDLFLVVWRRRRRLRLVREPCRSRATTINESTQTRGYASS